MCACAYTPTLINTCINQKYEFTDSRLIRIFQITALLLTLAKSKDEDVGISYETGKKLKYKASQENIIRQHLETLEHRGDFNCC